jgi:hypothetical protein
MVVVMVMVVTRNNNKTISWQAGIDNLPDCQTKALEKSLLVADLMIQPQSPSNAASPTYRIKPDLLSNEPGSNNNSIVSRPHVPCQEELYTQPNTK